MSHISANNPNRYQMKVVIINKSDSTGGAAVVSRRLMEALRSEGVDAHMLVTEKLTDSPYVELAASPNAIRKPFLAERLKIFISNGFNRKTLFKIDTASDGMPLWNHPLVKEADAVLLNWVNQGMLSLKGIRNILNLGKPVIWTMHDMWCMTGICHHAAQCEGFMEECGECPLLGRCKGINDISHKTWKKKIRLNRNKNKITYVAVSNWLADKALESSLLFKENVIVIPNAFTPPAIPSCRKKKTDEIRILFGAARLDDPIKGLPVLIEMTHIIKKENPELAQRLRLVTFGGVKNPASLEGIEIPHDYLGIVHGEEKIREVYEAGDILVSASSYETLPGTLVEAQAYGCIPVSFNRGGQADIIDHLSTGYIANYSGDIKTAAGNLAEGIRWAVALADDPASLENIQKRMYESVATKFSPHAVANAYIDIISQQT
ncbi:MAG: glycosyltransferase [Bacteroides sp.]|nr:glycosyltransferase [Bacteroides sp.]